MTDRLRILIADDNSADRLILQTIITKQGHEVLVTCDGVEALETFRRERPDIVLLDAIMPNMDGLEAAREIKMLAGDDLVPIIFLTSLTDAASLAECLAAGGDDFLSKPYSPIILKAKVDAFARMKVLHETVQLQRDEIQRHNDYMVHEQEVAKAVFDNIAHPGCVNAENIRVLLSPMAIFNGDLVLATHKPAGGMYVFLADFTGHGLPAAIGAMPISNIFYGMSKKGFPLPDIIREMNKTLKKILPVGVFCCSCLVDINYRKGLVEYWLGGLPDLIIYRKDGSKYDLLPSRKLPLGILSDEKFDASTGVFEMERGDRLVISSDGIHEVMNARQEMFGEVELKRILGAHKPAGQLFDAIVNAVRAFAGNTDTQSDDYTLVEVEMVSHKVFSDTSVQAHRAPGVLGPMDWSMSYELRPSTLRSFNPLPMITHMLMNVPGLRASSDKVYAVLSELYSNALEHGVMGLESTLKQTPAGFAAYYREREERLKKLEKGSVSIALDHRATPQGGELTISVKDTGEGFDFRSKGALDMPLNGYSGRGIPLVRRLCKQVAYKGKGNHVTAVFSWIYDT